MYLKSVDILNYRAFYGRNYFDFSTNGNNSLNIIFGGNGSGKSSLIDAIYWCLYGIEMREGGSEPIYNDIIAEETLNDDKFKVKVSLSFTNAKNQEIVIIRSIYFNKSDYEVVGNFVDFEIYVDGTQVSYKETFIREFCNRNLFNLMYIREIGDLFNSEWGNGLKSVLFRDFQLDVVSNTSMHLKKSYNKFLKEFKDINSEDYMFVRYNELVTAHDDVVSKINNVYNDIDKIQELLNQYRNNSDNKDLLMKKETLLKERDYLHDHLSQKTSKYSHLVLSSFPMAVLFNDLESNFDEFKISFENHCGDDNIKTSFSEYIYNLKHDLNDLKKNILGISEYNKLISNLEEKLNDVHYNLREIDEMLKCIDAPEINKIDSLEGRLKYLVKERDFLKYEDNSLKKDISSLEMEIKVNQSKSSELHKKVEFYRNAIDSFNKLQDNLSRSVLDELSNSMNSIFIQDFGMSDKFSNILVSDDFEFGIVKNSGKVIKFLDLSSSEQYILYLSFALSIQNIINQNIFLIIDTQFLSFDKQHWLRFLSLLKNTDNQCFLLFNDVWYDNDVKSNLMNNICNVYELTNYNGAIEVVKHEK